jgi:hypothetical protein
MMLLFKRPSHRAVLKRHNRRILWAGACTIALLLTPPMAFALVGVLDPAKVTLERQGNTLVLHYKQANGSIVDSTVELEEIQAGQAFFHWTETPDTSQWIRQGGVPDFVLDYLLVPRNELQSYGPGFYVSQNPADSHTFGTNLVQVNAPRRSGSFWVMKDTISIAPDNASTGTSQAKAAKATFEMLRKQGILGTHPTGDWYTFFDKRALSDVSSPDPEKVLDAVAASGNFNELANAMPNIQTAAANSALNSGLLPALTQRISRASDVFDLNSLGGFRAAFKSLELDQMLDARLHALLPALPANLNFNEFSYSLDHLEEKPEIGKALVPALLERIPRAKTFEELDKLIDLVKPIQASELDASVRERIKTLLPSMSADLDKERFASVLQWLGLHADGTDLFPNTLARYFAVQPKPWNDYDAATVLGTIARDSKDEKVRNTILSQYQAALAKAKTTSELHDLSRPGKIAGGAFLDPIGNRLQELLGQKEAIDESYLEEWTELFARMEHPPPKALAFLGTKLAEDEGVDWGAYDFEIALKNYFARQENPDLKAGIIQGLRTHHKRRGIYDSALSAIRCAARLDFPELRPTVQETLDRLISAADQEHLDELKRVVEILFLQPKPDENLLKKLFAKALGLDKHGSVNNYYSGTIVRAISQAIHGDDEKTLDPATIKILRSGLAQLRAAFRQENTSLLETGYSDRFLDLARKVGVKDEKDLVPFEKDVDFRSIAGPECAKDFAQLSSP